MTHFTQIQSITTRIMSMTSTNAQFSKGSIKICDGPHRQVSSVALLTHSRDSTNESIVEIEPIIADDAVVLVQDAVIRTEPIIENG